MLLQLYAGVLEPKIARRLVLPFLLAIPPLAFLFWIQLATPAGVDDPVGLLARAFVAGRLDFVPDPNTPIGDRVPFEGRYYWPLGPLPSIAIMPFVWLGQVPPFLSFVVFGAVFLLCYALARRLDYGVEDAAWLGVAFAFGSSFVNHLLGGHAVTNHSLTVMLLFWAALEHENRRRFWVISLAVGLAMAARIPAGLNILCFVTLALPDRRKLVEVGLPFAACVALLALYNYARFGDPFEFGYSYQIHGATGLLYSELDVPGNRPGPQVSLSHFTTNFSVAFFGLPEVRAVGSSMLLLSPYLVYLWRVRWDRTTTIIGANCALVLTFLLCFRSSGFEQVGYRFSLDFLPMLFWATMRGRVPVSRGFKVLVGVAVIVDLFLVLYFLYSGADRRLLARA